MANNMKAMQIMRSLKVELYTRSQDIQQHYEADSLRKEHPTKDLHVYVRLALLFTDEKVAFQQVRPLDSPIEYRATQ
jgi:hypothetical protein